jgi:hypothetical protein
MVSSFSHVFWPFGFLQEMISKALLPALWMIVCPIPGFAEVVVKKFQRI